MSLSLNSRSFLKGLTEKLVVAKLN
jgi:hypothetical protein